ncbi:hypothetical protein HGA64_02080 [Candidatus Falkowbacteria bacterium]|nr:hypothetical protein [Candidatus Falkowbacteria bacterium]
MAYNRYIRIYLQKVKISIMSRMVNPANFFVLLFGVVAQAYISIYFLKVVYGYVENISGWSYEQALLVIASFLFIEGLIWITTAYLSGVRNNVRNGTLDTQLIKPVDSQFLISVWRIDPEDVMRIVVAFIIFLQAAGHFHYSFADWVVRTFFYAILIFDGYVIFYSIALMINSLYCWFTEAGGMHMIFESVIRMSQYPTDIFNQSMVKYLFSSLVPIAFIGTIPAKAIAFGPRFDLMIYANLLAFLLFIISRRVWHAGLRAYSSASS